MRKQADIHLADLLEALQLLGPADAEAQRAILGMLGLTMRPSAPAGNISVGNVNKEEKAVAEVAVFQQAAGTVQEPARQRSSAPAQNTQPRSPSIPRLRLSPLDAGWSDFNHWLDTAATGVPEAPKATPSNGQPAPLFRPMLIRQILVAALSVMRPEGAPDLERATADIALGRIVECLVRRRQPTLRHGAQVLVDIGEGMTGFIFDQKDTVARLLRLLDPERLDVHEFMMDDGEFWMRSDADAAWEPYQPPSTPRPVLMLGDVGIGDAGRRTHWPEAVWLPFFERLRRSGSHLVAVVPYPRNRVPAALARHAIVIPWDRSTGVAEVARGLHRRRTRT